MTSVIAWVNHQVQADEPRFAGGTWHSFPIPDQGFYDVRRVIPTGFPALEHANWYYWDNKHCSFTGRRLTIIGRRVDKLRPEDGWQFRFRPGTESWRPFAITYSFDANGSPVVADRRDISNQLPMARSKAEALYLVRAIPRRWPIFWKIHVEYTEEPHRS